MGVLAILGPIMRLITFWVVIIDVNNAIIFQGAKVLEVITIHLKRLMADLKTKYGNATAAVSRNVT